MCLFQFPEATRSFKQAFLFGLWRLNNRKGCNKSIIKWLSRQEKSLAGEMCWRKVKELVRVDLLRVNCEVKGEGCILGTCQEGKETHSEA